MGVYWIVSTVVGYRFELRSSNGRVLAVSTPYRSKAACRRGIDSMRRCCGAPLEDQTAREAEPPPLYPKYQLGQSEGGGYRFRLRARNGVILAVSRRYHSKAACLNGIESVRRNGPEAAVAYF